MTRRAVLVAAAAVALILAPGAAMAYSPSTTQAAVVASSVTQAAVVVTGPMADPTPKAGVPFSVRATGATANEAVTLTITRRPASTGNPRRLMTKSANASGVVEFEVAIAKDGTYSLVSTSSKGSVLGRQSVTVVDQGSVIVAGEGASAAAGGTTAGKASGRAPQKAAGAAAGQAAGRASVKVAGVAAGTVASGRLSSTGFQGMGLAVIGGVLVLLGSVLVRVAGFPRSRKPESPRVVGRRGSQDEAQAPA